MELVVGILGRPRGLRGEIAVQLRTDSPEERFRSGQEFRIANEPFRLTVKSAQNHAGRWYVQFQEITDRTGAEAVNGLELKLDAAPEPGPDEWYIYQLVGLHAYKVDGSLVGEITEVLPLPAQDVLVIRQVSDGSEALVPLVADFVPDVDVDAGRITIDPPFGLLAGEEVES